MSISVETLAVAKKYTNDSLAGAGAVAGVPCQIQSKTAITGGTRITFLWVDNNGNSHTTAMDVMNGIDGKDGKGIQSVSVNENNHLIITYSDGTTDDAGQIEIHSAVDSVNGQTGNVTLDAEDVGALPDDTPIPSKTSDLTNDSGFITKVVNDLVSYYLKSETYSKTEVDDIVTAIKNSRFEVVATLPTTDIKTNVIYLVPKSPSQTSNVKDEYINLDGTTTGWEKIGDTEIDLSDYVTTQALNTALANYTTTADLTTLLAGKQDTLTFDNVPTENSNNPVKSGGVYSADDKIYQVMGQNSAKNFIPFDLDRIKAKNTTGTWNGNVYSVNGIDFTFNSDGTVDASGTATETASVHYYDPVGLPPFGGDRILRLTGCPSGGSGTTYKVMAYRAGEVDGSTGTAEEYGDGISLRWLNNGSGIKAFVSISVYTGAGTIDVTFKPMLRLSTDTDNTFAPYAKTNQELTAENEALTNEVTDMNNVLGAKNLLPTPYYSTKGGTTTSGTLTVTENADGSVTIDGTASGQSYIDLARNDKFLKAGTYILSGGITSKQYMYINCLNNGTYIKTLASAMTSEVKFVLDYNGYDAITVGISIASGESLSNVTFYPMIRIASDPDDTHVPYAKTNQQLTQDSITWDDLREVGAVNYLVYPYSETTHTSSNIIYTDNGDGSITVGTGTTSSGSPGSYAIANNTKDIQRLRGKAVKFSIDCDTVVDGNNANVQMTIYDSSNNLLYNHYLHMNGGRDKTILTVPSNADHVYIQAWNKRSTTISTAYTVKPMITPVSYNGPYVPYAKTNRELTEKIDIVGNLFTTTTKVVDNITHGIATTIATLENLPIGTYVVSGQFNSDSAMSGGGLVQFASSGVIQNGASCSTIINQGFKANAGLTGIFNVTNATNQINLQIYTANADLTVASARLAAIRIA